MIFRSQNLFWATVLPPCSKKPSSSINTPLHLAHSKVSKKTTMVLQTLSKLKAEEGNRKIHLSWSGCKCDSHFTTNSCGDKIHLLLCGLCIFMTNLKRKHYLKPKLVFCLNHFWIPKRQYVSWFSMNNYWRSVLGYIIVFKSYLITLQSSEKSKVLIYRVDCKVELQSNVF